MRRLVNWLLRSVAVCALAAGAGSPRTEAFAADLPVKAPAPAPAAAGCAPAVDGLNGKLAGLGGTQANDTLYGALGSVSVPLGCEFGAQFDATGASFDGRFLGAAAAHFFWRDPSKALVGLYGAYTYWDRVGGVRIGHVGPEGELYLGRWTLQGVAGIEFGNSASGTINGLVYTYDVKTRFFDEVNLAYYLQDDLKVYVGHRYLGGKNALALGGEYGIPLGGGVMTSLFAEARVGEGDYHGIWGGVRFYFGRTDKSLMRRHREDDPNEWNVGIDGLPNTGSTSAIGAPPPPPPPPPSENGPV